MRPYIMQYIVISVHRGLLGHIVKRCKDFCHPLMILYIQGMYRVRAMYFLVLACFPLASSKDVGPKVFCNNI